MRYFVLGAGLVGLELARELRGAGHEVVGTTTTPAKVDALLEVFDDVRVLKGIDRELIRDALAGVDGVVVSAGPRAATDEAERERIYREALVETAESVVWAVRESGMSGPVIAMSSTSVYGGAQNDRDVILEDGPLTEPVSASARNFQAMERIYAEGLPEQSVVLRCTEIYGDDDTPIEVALRGAHEHMGGSLPFAADALLYRTHAREVVAALVHALGAATASTGVPLQGVYNLASAQVPVTNSERFDAVSLGLGLPAFTYLGVIEAPTKPLSVARLAATGFTVGGRA
jgi:nucleoside-diphosphate-sugar epimerase